jgi:hypothetical protein
MENFKLMNDRDFYKYCCQVGSEARKWKNQFVSLLPEVARRGLHKKYGFATVVEFAAKIGGVGKSTVEAVFQVEKHVKDKPVLKNLIPKVGLAKVRTVATIATNDNQKELAEKIENMTKAALQLYVRDIRQQRENETCQIRAGSEVRIESTRVNLNFNVDRATELKLRIFKQKLEKKKREAVEWNDVMNELLAIAESANAPKKVVRKTSAKKPIFAKPATRYIPVQIRHELEEKYKGGCAYEGCDKPAQIYHHKDRWALTKSHKNLQPLCRAHHELAHRGLLNEIINPLKNMIDKKMLAHARGP